LAIAIDSKQQESVVAVVAGCCMTSKTKGRSVEVFYLEFAANAGEKT
jgi:hypothetical protein